MKLSLPNRTFNAQHTYFFAISGKLLRENMQKHYKPHIIYLTTEENKSQAVRKQFFFLMRSCSIRRLVLHSDNDYMQKSTSCDLRLSTRRWIKF